MNNNTNRRHTRWRIVLLWAFAATLLAGYLAFNFAMLAIIYYLVFSTNRCPYLNDPLNGLPG